jgi:dolichyl-phosphate-mannose--protein O-mannosyl transferase
MDVMKKSFFQYLTTRRHYVLAALVGVGVIGGLLARYYQVGVPSYMMLEEGFFVQAARGYLHHSWVYQDHPPFGILLMSAGMGLLGDTSTAWRIMPALSGIVILVLLGYIAWELFRSKAAVAITVFLAALDGFFIVYSRAALTDGILLALILGTFLSLLKVKRSRDLMWITGTLFGLAICVKMSGLFLLGPILYYVFKKKLWRGLPGMLIWAVVLYWAILVLSKILANLPGPFLDAWHWQLFAVKYHTTVYAGLGERWWTWPFMRDSYKLMETYHGIKIAVVKLFANPLILWSSTVTFFGLGGLYVWNLTGRLKKSTSTLLSQAYEPLLVAYVSFYLPWIIYIQRIEFIYHYWFSYTFALLILAGVLAEVWKKWWWITIIILSLFLWAAWYFFPLWTGLFMPMADFLQRIWLPGWR